MTAATSAGSRFRIVPAAALRGLAKIGCSAVRSAPKSPASYNAFRVALIASLQMCGEEPARTPAPAIAPVTQDPVPDGASGWQSLMVTVE